MLPQPPPDLPNATKGDSRFCGNDEGGGNDDIKALKGRPVHSTGQRPVNRHIKPISPERATENNGGECHNKRGFGFAVFAGLCPAKEWDALTGLD